MHYLQLHMQAIRKGIVVAMDLAMTKATKDSSTTSYTYKIRAAYAWAISSLSSSLHLVLLLAISMVITRVRAVANGICRYLAARSKRYRLAPKG